jgi:geranylgeranyl pyrophosphate synthase
MLVTERNIRAEVAKIPTPAQDWKRIVEPLGPFLDKVAESLASQVSAFHAEIAQYARYALTNQGKQLRPALVGLSGTAVGHVNEALVKGGDHY